MGKIIRCQECAKAYRDAEELEELRDNDSECLVCNAPIEVSDWDRILASWEEDDAENAGDDDEDWSEDDAADDEEEGDEDLVDPEEFDGAANLDGDDLDGDGDDLDEDDDEDDAAADKD